MNILFFVSSWAGVHNSGAEWTAHHYASYLHSKGCKIFVWTNQENEIPIGEKFSFISFVRDRKNLHLTMKKIDVVITHLESTGEAINISKIYRKQLVFLSHNDNDYRILRARFNNSHVVYNNRKNKENITGGKYPNDSIICKPPIIPEDVQYNRKHGQYITLINCNENKGGNVLIQLAKRLPKFKFLGVLGSYGDQIVDNNQKNIKYIKQTDEIRLIYGKSNIILMPSKYESYGRVALESAINRLPVICSPTDGLKECLGNAGLYYDRQDIEGMALKIEELMTDEILYDFHQNIMRNLAEERLNYQEQELNRFYTFIESKAKKLYDE